MENFLLIEEFFPMLNVPENLGNKTLCPTNGNFPREVVGQHFPKALLKLFVKVILLRVNKSIMKQTWEI